MTSLSLVIPDRSLIISSIERKLYCSWYAAGSWPCPLVRTFRCRNCRPSVATSSWWLEVATLGLQLRHHHVHTRGREQEPAAYQERYNFLSISRNSGYSILQPRTSCVAGTGQGAFSLSKVSRTYSSNTMRTSRLACAILRYMIGPT